MRRVISLLALAVFVLAAAPTAEASIESIPIRARMEWPERLPEAGRAFSGVIRIEAAATAEMRDLVLAGEGWSVSRYTAPRNLTLDAGERIQVEFTATPGSTFGPLVVSAEVAGRSWRQSFNLSREAFGGLLPADSDRLPSQRILPSGGDRLPAHPEYSLAELEAMAAAPDDPSAMQVWNKERSACTVTGNVVYWHEDGHWAHPANPGIYVYGQGVIPFLYGFVLADEVGQFSIEVPTGVEIRLEYRPANDAVRVQDNDTWSSTYKWSTPFFTIPAGTTSHDLGPIYPNRYHGALHICTVITHCRNNFRDVGQAAGFHWNVQRIDVEWPSYSRDASSYNPGGPFSSPTIFITPQRTWNDGVISHEWGHYWNHMHAHNPDFDYCNGICDADPPDKCGHCLWCPEESAVAWLEGVAHIISRLNTEYLVPRVVHNVQHMGIETPHKEDTPDCPWDPWHIEGVVAGALWDIANDSRGTDTYGLKTDVLGSPLYDQLALGTTEILRVMTVHCDVEGHRPYRMPAYFRCMAERLTNLGLPDATVAMLWETAMNWDLQMDQQPPVQVPGLTSTFSVNTPLPQAIGGFYWNAPTDNMSGTAGYSVAMARGSSPVMPNQVIDTVRPQFWTSHLEPGTYYFSVIAVDRAGNWGTVPTSYGPIIITEPYPVDLQPYTPTGWTAPLVLRSDEVPAGPVTQPNIVHGHTIYFNLGFRNTAGGSSGLFRNICYIDGVESVVSGQYGLGGMASGEQRNLGPLPNPDLIGRRTVWARIDGEDDVPELNEDNNIIAKQFVFRPRTLASGETVVRTYGLPQWNAGHELLPGYVTAYPNCDGFDALNFTGYPDLVWAVPDNPNDRLVMRLHQRNIGQDGFGEALITTESAPNRPAVILNNYFESNLAQFCIGVSDKEGSGNTYRIHREVCRTFVMPDTLDGTLTVGDCLDYYMVLNGVGQPRRFTVKLANPGILPLRLNLFNPALAYGSLTSAMTTIWAAPFDTVHTTVLLQPEQRMLVTVSRDPRFIGSSPYTISAYLAKSDLAAETPSGWFANLVPHIRRPHSVWDPVPAPTRLSANPDSTAVYWSLRNIGDAPAPIGMWHEVRLNDALLFGRGFVEPLNPDQEFRGVNPSHGGYHVPGGRHALTHHINPTFDIAEDTFDNNVHGRQWVWEPRLLSMSVTHDLTVPSNPYGGLQHVTEGLVALNCDGYRLSTHVTGSNPWILSVYVDGDGADVDVGFYSSADVQDGFTEALAQSTWSGDGCDFVLRAVAPGTHTSYVGLVRGFAFDGNPWGDVTLRADEMGGFTWQNPLDGSLTNMAIEGETFMHAFRLAGLPPGDYLFTLQTEDAWPYATPVALGFSLHDMSDGYSAKTSPMQSAIAWQVPGSGDFGNVSFQVTIPDPAPSMMALAVWRPDSVDPWDDAYYVIHVSVDYTSVEDTDTVLPTPDVSRLVSAAPNPFNPATSITFDIARTGHSVLTVHDLRGRVVQTLAAGDLQPGRHTVNWNGQDNTGRRMPSGVYMVRLRTVEGEAGMLKLMLVK